MLTEQEAREKLVNDVTTSLKNNINILIYVYGTEINRETIYKWLTTFRYFRPTQLSIFRKGRSCPKRYSETALKEAALDKENNIIGISNTSCGNVQIDINGKSSSFCATIPISVWEEKKDEIIKNYQEIFIELDGCFGFAINPFDDRIIQNPRSVDTYKCYNLTEADFPGIHNIPIIKGKISFPYQKYERDSSYLPGHRLFYGGMAFTVAHYMWFGPDFYRFFSKEKLENFQNCHENFEIIPGYRKICLCEDITKYNAPLYRERQWHFRKEIEMDEILKELNSKPFVYKNKPLEKDPMIEMFKGNFSHGGTLLVKFYVDKKGRNCVKSEACAYIQREMLENDIVWQERFSLCDG